MHFKDLNLLSNTDVQEHEKSKESLTKEIKDQQLSYSEEEEIAKNQIF